jgi:hypothetical protein
MSLSDLFAAYATETQDEAALEKQAQEELYVKIASEYCAANGVDFDNLSQEQHSMLWDAIFTSEKSAEEEEKKDDDKKEESKSEKKDDEEKAKEEFAKEKQAADSYAMSEALGRSMARAFDEELQKIASERAQEEAKKEASARQSTLRRVEAPISAIDKVAAQAAVKIAYDQGGYDPEDTERRLVALLTLGAPETAKLASGTYEERVQARALELLVAAGYR